MSKRTRIALIASAHAIVFVLAPLMGWWAYEAQAPYTQSERDIAALMFAYSTMFVGWIVLGAGFRVNRLPTVLDWLAGYILAAIYLVAWHELIRFIGRLVRQTMRAQS